MSTRTSSTTVCDEPDERRGEHPAHRTVRFGIDGKAWERDVCGPHYRDMALALAPFVDAAHPARDDARPRSRSRSARTAAIRAWALGRGMSISERGRIPAAVIAKYEAAHPAMPARRR